MLKFFINWAVMLRVCQNHTCSPSFAGGIALQRITNVTSYSRPLKFSSSKLGINYHCINCVCITGILCCYKLTNLWSLWSGEGIWWEAKEQKLRAVLPLLICYARLTREQSLVSSLRVSMILLFKWRKFNFNERDCKTCNAFHTKNWTHHKFISHFSFQVKNFKSE